MRMRIQSEHAHAYTERACVCVYRLTLRACACVYRSMAGLTLRACACVYRASMVTNCEHEHGNTNSPLHVLQTPTRIAHQPPQRLCRQSVAKPAIRPTPRVRRKRILKMLHPLQPDPRTSKTSVCKQCLNRWSNNPSGFAAVPLRGPTLPSQRYGGNTR
jgi:hypothetical protein